MSNVERRHFRGREVSAHIFGLALGSTCVLLCHRRYFWWLVEIKMDNTTYRSTCLGTWKLCYAHQNRLKARITLVKIKNVSKVHNFFYFFTPFYFEIILDPHESQKHNTERSCVSFTQLPTIKLFTIISLYIYTLEEEMATHSSSLAWEIPRMEEPGELQSMGSRRVGHNLATKTTTTTYVYI